MSDIQQQALKTMTNTTFAGNFCSVCGFDLNSGPAHSCGGTPTFCTACGRLTHQGKCDGSYVPSSVTGIHSPGNPVTVSDSGNAHQSFEDRLRASESEKAELRRHAQAFLDKVTEVGKVVDGVIGLQAARGYPYTGPNWGTEHAALTAALAGVPPQPCTACVEKDRVAVEFNILAHQWMHAHDALQAGEKYDFPSPVEVPALMASLESKQGEIDRLREKVDRFRAALYKFWDETGNHLDVLAALSASPAETPKSTIIMCPSGCGGSLDSSDQYCPACRYAVNEQRIQSNPDWCWEWFGAMTHRMKCRRNVGHAGDHHDHEDSDSLFSLDKLSATAVPAQAEPKRDKCIRCGAAYTPWGSCSNSACQGGRGEGFAAPGTAEEEKA